MVAVGAIASCCGSVVAVAIRHDGSRLLRRLLQLELPLRSEVVRHRVVTGLLVSHRHEPLANIHQVIRCFSSTYHHGSQTNLLIDVLWNVMASQSMLEAGNDEDDRVKIEPYTSKSKSKSKQSMVNLPMQSLSVPRR